MAPQATSVSSTSTDVGPSGVAPARARARRRPAPPRPRSAAATKVVPVVRLAAERDEGPARHDRAAVGRDPARDAPSPRVRRAPRAARRRRRGPRVDAARGSRGMGVAIVTRCSPRDDAAPASARRASSRSSKGCFTVPDDLVVLVALAGDQDDVARASAERTARSIAFRRSSSTTRLVARHARTPGDDRPRRWPRGSSVARVVARHDGHVGAPRDRLAHGRALGRVAVPAAAEDAPDAARRDARGRRRAPARARRGCGRSRRATITSSPGDVAPLEPPGRAGSSESASAARPRSSSSACAMPSARAGSRGCARRRAASRARTSPRRGPHRRASMPCARRSAPRAGRSSASRRASRARSRARAAPVTRWASVAAERVVHVEDGRARAELGEEARLGRRVRLHRAVEVEVVLGQVRQRRDAERARRARARAASACDETSIATCVAPRARIAGHRARELVGLGRRVLRVGAPAAEASGRPCRAPRSSAAPSAPSTAARTRCAVVVLPLVPVIPTTSSANDGCP